MMKIAASVLNCDLLHLKDEIKKVQLAGVDAIHLDVMDGHFVPNLSFGVPILKIVKPLLSVPIFSHLMVIQPESVIEQFVNDSDAVIFHVEATDKIDQCLDIIKTNNKLAGIAINPDTVFDKVAPYLHQIYEVLVMSVFPGFGGQGFIPDSLTKIKNIKDLITRNKYNTLIGVDGGVGPNNTKLLIESGADILVAGTAIFKSKDYAETIRKMREI
jgi:ribulose-phosphate 3-epimerase